LEALNEKIKKIVEIYVFLVYTNIELLT